MEELDLLKKAWKKDESFEQVSEKEIYKMLHQKSSSIVKWILIISLIEFIFWNIFTIVFSDDKYQAKLHSYGVEELMFTVNVLNYVIILVFIFVFYKNYRNISTTDSTRQLMKSILKTRKTVQNYIWYNLGVVTVSIIISIVMLFYHNPKMISLLEKADAEGNRMFFLTVCTGISVLFILLIIGIFWIFYKVLYGILLKKLFENYKELKKIEL
jgi:type II secretory pathway component PulF